MQKRVKNIIVLSIGVVALSFVSIASGVFPISALTGEPSTTSNETETSASQTDVMIDISDFFEHSDEESEIEYGDNEFVDPFTPDIFVDNDVTMEDFIKDTQTQNSVNSVQTTEESSIENNIISVSLLYNNSYSEKILLEGEPLSAEITVSNTDSLDDIVVMLAYYSNGKMIDVNTTSYEQSANGENGFVIDSVVPAESNVTNAKIFVLKSIQSLSPYCPAIELTTVDTDYYGDTYLSAQPISQRNSANGSINSENDADVFSFVPQSDGLYYFESFSDIDTYAVLYDSEDITTPITSGDNEGADNNFRISETLQANKTYYLYVYGRSTGEYSLNYGYAVGNIFGTVSPVKYYNDDMIFNEEVETTINIRTYHTDEYVATLHLKDWSQSNLEFASFSITGIHAGDYIVEISRPGYITYLKKIKLSDDAIDLGSIELIPGDANEDSTVDTNDIALLTELDGVSYGEENYVVSADFNGDKVIDSTDLAISEANQSKTVNSYNQNIIIPTLDISVVDTEMTVSGIAKAEASLHCNIYLNGSCLYEEVIVCDSDGTYEYLIELNRAGQYEVEVYEDTPVLASRQILNYE